MDELADLRLAMRRSEEVRRVHAALGFTRLVAAAERICDQYGIPSSNLLRDSGRGSERQAGSDEPDS